MPEFLGRQPGTVGDINFTKKNPEHKNNPQSMNDNFVKEPPNLVNVNLQKTSKL